MSLGGEANRNVRGREPDPIRDSFKRGKYQDVILAVVALRRP